MIDRIRAVSQLLIGLLPSSRAKNLLMSLSSASWSVASTARVSPCVLWSIRNLRIGREATVGFGNVFRSLRVVDIGDEGALGQFNWVSAAARVNTDGVGEMHRAFVLAGNGALTSRHYLECSGGVRIGSKSTVAGVRSTLMSHGPDLRTSWMHAQPIEIGDACFVASNVVITRGCKVADRIFVGAGSVVVGDLTQSNSLYAGVPCKHVKDVPSAKYFDRDGTLIDPDRALNRTDRTVPERSR